MYDFAIREATKADFDGVGKVFAEELEHHIDLLPGRFQMADPIMTSKWYDELLFNPDKTLLVAEMGEKIAGLVLIQLKRSSDNPIYRPRRFADIDELAVAKRYRGQGIGRALMDAAHKFIRSQGIDEVELDVWERNSGAIAFYEKLGYAKLRRKMQFILSKE